MAYAAVNSLIQTIQRLSKSRHISIVGDSSPQIKEFLYEQLGWLGLALKDLDRSVYSSNAERVNALDAHIRDAVYELEDVIETHISDQFGEDDDPRSLLVCIDLQDLKEDFDSITKRLEKMKEAYIEEVMNPTPEEEKVNDPIWRPDSEEKKSKMVGLSRFHSQIREMVIKDQRYDRSVCLTGMAGVGKTALAKEIFEDPAIVDGFECRAWVAVGPKFEAKKILRSILAQVDPDTDQMVSWEELNDQELAAYMIESLKDRRYLVVFDDLWKCDLFRTLPRNGNASRVLITSRVRQVYDRRNLAILDNYTVPFLDKEESWQLLRDKVFGEDGSCPRQLEKAGKKIAQNCEGLPLTILRVAKILSEAEKTLEFWNNVAEKESSIFLDAYDQMLKVLYPSYYYLPQFSKACFLYMGVFPQKYELPLSKIIDLWSAEGFLKCGAFEEIVKSCLDEFQKRNVFIVRHKIRESGTRLVSNFNNKKYHVNSALLHLCVSEARNIKFYRMLNRYNEDAAHGVEDQRRLCIRNNVLFSIKDMYNLMTSITNARSLLCTGPYHQYPVPICLGLRLLRVLDVLTIRFYEFPIEVLKLIHLRYFALTYDGNLPDSISKLLNLESLIVNQHLSIKSSAAPSYLPMEIWDMQELKHLQVTGWDLPEPREGSLLPNLLTLIDVSSHSCTKRILDRTPNLKKLGIRITSTESIAVKPFSLFYNIIHLHELTKFKCIFTNPFLTSEVMARRPRALPIFPSRLRRLSLGGLGSPWEEMGVIASLPCLEVLRLRCYAFRGPKWETHVDEFQRLEYLSIEDSDVVVWMIGADSFRSLCHLNIEHCYKLEEVRGELRRVKKIEVVDSNPLGVACAQEISSIDVDVTYS